MTVALTWPALLALVALTACGSSNQPAVRAHELNVYSWSDFLDPELLARYQKETGIQVKLTTFPSQQVLEATLLTGHTDYDVAVVSRDELGGTNRLITRTWTQFRSRQ